jgi:hypothetical protein
MTEALRYLLSSYLGPSPPPSAVTPTMASQLLYVSLSAAVQVYSMSGIHLYQDAGMPMPAASTLMPIPSYDI